MFHIYMSTRKTFDISFKRLLNLCIYNQTNLNKPRAVNYEDDSKTD